ETIVHESAHARDVGWSHQAEGLIPESFATHMRENLTVLLQKRFEVEPLFDRSVLGGHAKGGGSGLSKELLGSAVMVLGILESLAAQIAHQWGGIYAYAASFGVLAAGFMLLS